MQKILPEPLAGPMPVERFTHSCALCLGGSALASSLLYELQGHLDRRREAVRGGGRARPRRGGLAPGVGPGRPALTPPVTQTPLARAVGNGSPRGQAPGVRPYHGVTLCLGPAAELYEQCEGHSSKIQRLYAYQCN